MYLDVSKKIKLLEEQIVKEYIERGEYPSINTINKHISDLDPFRSMHKQKKFYSGEYLNAEDLNEEQTQILMDLRILYETIYEISVKEFTYLQGLLSSQINELKRITNKYVNKSSIVSNFNKLGKTIFYKDNNLPIINKIDHVEINLGLIQYMPNSYVSVIVDAINIDEDEIYIEIGDKTIKPYNFNKDKVFIPYINKEINEHTFNLPEESGILSPVNIPIKDENNKEVELNTHSKYIISTGKDQALVTYDDQQKLIDINNLEFDNEAVIEFIILNGTNVSIKSNKEFKYCNFNQSENNININSYVRKFKIITNPNTVINISNNDGEIYAVRSEGTILNKKLYFNELLHNNSFFIEEFLESERVQIPTKVKIFPTLTHTPSLNSIEIKESINIGGEIND